MMQTDAVQTVLGKLTDFGGNVMSVGCVFAPDADQTTKHRPTALNQGPTWCAGGIQLRGKATGPLRGACGWMKALPIAAAD